MKQIFIFMTTAMLLVGCGSTGGSSSNSGSSTAPEPEPEVPSDIVMVTLEPYTVFPGDQLVKSVPEALVRISHIDGKDESTVVLLEGDAIIIPRKENDTVNP